MRGHKPHRTEHLLLNGKGSPVSRAAFELQCLGRAHVTEGITTSYMTRMLRLTQLEPGIIEAVLDGRQGDAVTLARLMDPFPISWIEQKNTFSGT